jgi:hypothetical protein
MSGASASYRSSTDDAHTPGSAVASSLVFALRAPGICSAVAPRETAVSGTGRDEEQELAAGRREWTPFAMIGLVALVIAVVVAIVAGVAFLVIWLA